MADFIEAQQPTLWGTLLEVLGLRKATKLDLGLSDYAKPVYRFSEPGSSEAERAISAYVAESGARPFEARAAQANAATQERQGGTPMKPMNQQRTRAFMERHLVDAISPAPLRGRMRDIISKPNRAVRDFDAAQGEGIFIDRPELRTKR